MEAVLFGRFNLTTTGHVDYFKTVQQKYGKINICIATTKTSNNIPAGYEEFYAMSDRQHEKNIFTIEERYTMLKASLIAEGLIDYTKIHIINRPDYFIDEFNYKFPVDKFQVVVAGGKDFEERQAFSEILNRNIDFIDLNFETHISDVILKNNSDEINRTTKQYLACGCYEIFHQINGVERMLQ